MLELRRDVMRWRHVLGILFILLFPILVVKFVLAAADDGFGTMCAAMLYFSTLSVIYVIVFPWALIGLRERNLFIGLIAFGQVAAGAIELHGRVNVQPNSTSAATGYLIGTFLCGAGLIHILFARTGFPSPEVRLTFPLPAGRFCCVQGGATIVLNNHRRARSQQYACDIVKVDDSGKRATGMHPRELSRYEIYDSPVVSPCDGVVIATVTDAPDAQPGDRDLSQGFEGNVVVIRTLDADVVLAHLRKNSVLVRQGERVYSGMHIASVGNSGNSSEPHLHIHAERDGIGVPLSFDGIHLYRNRVVSLGEVSSRQ